MNDFTNDRVDKFLSVWSLCYLDGRPLKYEEFPILKAVKFGQKTSAEFIIKQKGLEDRVIWVNASPIYNQDRKIIAGITVFLDTTERYKMEQEIRAAKKTSEQASLAKSRFLDIAAHELRTPVTAFSLLIQLTQKKLDKGIPIDPSFLKKVNVQVDRINRLVVDLLDVSRLEKDMIKLDLKDSDLVHLITDCIDDMKLKYPLRQIEFLRPIEDVIIRIDPVRIYQVLSNLIDNAVKYTPDDSKIVIKTEKTEQNIQVGVVDYGGPILENLGSELFKPFTRGVGEFAEKAGGLGLGLFISRGIINLHGGEIGFTPTEDKGKMFYFTLPLDRQ